MNSALVGKVENDYKDLVKNTFELARRFGRFTYPHHDIDWSIVDYKECDCTYTAPPKKPLLREVGLEMLEVLTHDARDFPGRRISVSFDSNYNLIAKLVRGGKK